MAGARREFQDFAKPAGPVCNLECRYCYYLKKKDLYEKGDPLRMSDDILEEYIVQHIDASRGEVIRFSWHGGEGIALKIRCVSHKESDNSMGVLPYYGGSNLIASEAVLTFRGSDAQGAPNSHHGREVTVAAGLS